MLILTPQTKYLTQRRYPIYIYQTELPLIPLAIFIFASMRQLGKLPITFLHGKVLMENLSLFVIDEAPIKNAK